MTRNRSGLPVFLVAAIPVAAVRIGVGFIRFQARRKRGVRSFRATLIQNGMPRDRASILAQSYHDAGSLRRILRGPELPSDRA
jgi:hypothetical protein